MGVKGLHGFVEAALPRREHTITLEQLRAAGGDATDTIVVDGMALIRRMYARSLDWVSGGQYQELWCNVRDFVAAFRHYGLRLVVFFDGGVDEVTMWSRALSAARTPAGTDAPTHVTHAGPGAAMSMTRQTHRDTPPGRCRGARWGSPRLPGLRARLRDDSGREMSGCACPWSEPSETSPRATVLRPNGTNKRTWMKKSEN